MRNPKTKRDRVVPMSRTLFELLDRKPRHIRSPYVFTNPQTGTCYDRFDNTTWRATVRRAGIENFRWHDLRHTFGSRLAQAGVPILAIRELMGHSRISVTMGYAHMAESNLRDAVATLDGYGEPSRGEEVTTHMTTHVPKTAPRKVAQGAISH